MQYTISFLHLPMSKSLPTHFDAIDAERRLYKMWEKSGAYSPDHATGSDPFCVMMPPPNVTGVLHLGHALENSIMDAKVRWARMHGYKTLLLPGTDHAAIATQAKVERILMDRGMTHPRTELGRDALLQEIRTYAEESKSIILSQIRAMGTSCDWSRLAYTFDEPRSNAVNAVFKKMYDDGLIYRGHRVVNWSVTGQSTCSDDEVEHVERTATLYTFRYSADFPIAISTTRPETKLGDTAVAVHPRDTRYNKYIGQTFTVDVGSAQPLTIKVIASHDVDPTFGTGALGVTPAHSAVDFDMYEKQKALGDPIDLIQVIDTNGTMTAASGRAYAGLTVAEAREKFVAWLRTNKLLQKEEDITQNVGISDRFKDVVEALPMTQWFVDVNKKIPGRNVSLKDLMRNAVTVGHNNDPAQKITITPQRFTKNYLHWIDNLRDWSISRQIWWGHRIPVWYCPSGHMTCATQAPRACATCAATTLTQDDDTLDTWFSSGLWTFSTLGWPENTVDFRTFHPTTWIQMGHEILFFWMARMILMSTYTLDTIPFRSAYIHGMLCDRSGKKFSKSAGNNIDPLEIGIRYGTDALRLSLLTGITSGNDSHYYEEKVVGARNFVNKLWNIGRFISKRITQNPPRHAPTVDDLTDFDVMILGKMHDTIASVRADFAADRFAQAIDTLTTFTWHDFADWYIEAAKFEHNTVAKNAVLRAIFTHLLALWHPIIPFVTEELWGAFRTESDKLLITTDYPTEDAYLPLLADREQHSRAADLVIGVITAIRTLRQEQGIAPNKKIPCTLHCDAALHDIIERHMPIIAGMRTNIVNAIVTKDAPARKSLTTTTEHGITIALDAHTALDAAGEKEKKEKELTAVTSYIATLTKKLSNEAFTTKAPPAVVNRERTKLADARAKEQELTAAIRRLRRLL